MSAVDPAAEVVGAELALADELGEPVGDDEDLVARELASHDAGRWLLPAAEQYAAAQAAPHTARTYRSTIRSFALFVQRELGLAPSVDALVLSTVLDYKRHLQAIDPDTGRPRAKDATIAKQLSALRGFARWLALDEDLAVDVRSVP